MTVFTLRRRLFLIAIALAAGFVFAMRAAAPSGAFGRLRSMLSGSSSTPAGGPAGQKGTGALPGSAAVAAAVSNIGVRTGTSYHHDTSPPLREMEGIPYGSGRDREEREANLNPKIPHKHIDAADGSRVQDRHVASPHMPAPILNFDGIPFPGVVCNCAPPDTDGEVGLT